MNVVEVVFCACKSRINCVIKFSGKYYGEIFFVQIVFSFYHNSTVDEV